MNQYKTTNIPVPLYLLFCRIIYMLIVWTDAYSSSSSDSTNLCLTSCHNLPLLWALYQLVMAVSKKPWKAKAPAKTVPTNNEFLLRIAEN